MKNTTRSSVIPVLAFLFLISCNAERSRNIAGGFESAATEAADQGATYALTDSARKVIKEADVRCRVADVQAATTDLERSVMTAGGTIAESRTENNIFETYSVAISSDSVKQVQRYTTTAHLRLRIPVQQLDSILSRLAGAAQFIDSRNLRLDDATLRYLGNKWKADASTLSTAAVHAGRLSRKTGDAIAAGDYDADRTDQIIDGRIENMNIDDRVRFATVSVDLYQPERLDVLLVANTASVMQPSFRSRIGDGLTNGVDMLKGCIVALLHIWPLVLAAVVVAVYLRRRRVGRVQVAARR